MVIGDNVEIGSNVLIANGARISDNVRIHHGAVLSTFPQDLKFGGEETTLEVGEGTVIRDLVRFASGRQCEPWPLFLYHFGLPLALQLLITPGTTAHADTASHKLFGQGFLLEADGIAWFFDQYIDRHHRSDWRFAPLLAPDVDGVAPTCVILAECDPLVDEGLAYADRLRAAGVAVEMELYRGLTHDFIKLGRVLKEAGQAQQVAAEALKRAWEGAWT